MALEDFLGETSELKIIDFLAENMDVNYNQTEISEFTGLSRTTVNKKIPELIYNNILEIKEELGQLKTYQLVDNEIVKMIISASLSHSFKQAENPWEEEEAKEALQKAIGHHSVNEPNRFYVEPVCDYIIIPSGGEKKVEMKPARRTIPPVSVSA
ncbi:MAG: helix-turn-helix transcriptional regulator [Halobacteriota archaeon]|nr:helix-turn-helix transcriptional regulator [Halobacteriota archaeon]